MHIDSPRAQELAESLASQRKVSITDAVLQALEGEWRREAEARALAERLQAIARDLAAQGQPGGLAMTKAEVDEMWGH